ncbi:MAG: YXWGXW repeat-containing protein [Myxococcota bacterium]
MIPPFLRFPGSSGRLAGLVGLLVACGGSSQAERSLDSVRQVAAAELSCPAADLTVAQQSDEVFNVYGCGRQGAYRGGCNDETCTWSRMAAATSGGEAPASGEPSNPCPAEPASAASAEGVELQESCQLRVPQEDAEQTAPYGPPEGGVDEQRTAAPSANYVWISGRWYWTGTHYAWVSGFWVPPQAGFAYRPGRWVWAGGTWVYRPGGWVTVGTTTVVAPPPPRPSAVVWVRPVPVVAVTGSSRVVVVRRGPVYVRPAWYYRPAYRAPVYRYPARYRGPVVVRPAAPVRRTAPARRRRRVVY